MSSSRVLRHSESIDGFFCLCLNKYQECGDGEHRKLCEDIANDRDGSANDLNKWGIALEYASDAVAKLGIGSEDQLGKYLLYHVSRHTIFISLCFCSCSSMLTTTIFCNFRFPGQDLIRLHKRAASRFVSYDIADDAKHLFTIWLLYAKAQSKYGQKQSASKTFHHIQHKRLGEKEANLYISLAEFELSLKSSGDDDGEAENLVKAINVLKNGLDKGAEPKERLETYLDKLMALKSGDGKALLETTQSRIFQNNAVERNGGERSAEVKVGESRVPKLKSSSLLNKRRLQSSQLVESGSSSRLMSAQRVETGSSRMLSAQRVEAESSSVMISASKVETESLSASMVETESSRGTMFATKVASESSSMFAKRVETESSSGPMYATKVEPEISTSDTDRVAVPRTGLSGLGEIRSSSLLSIKREVRSSDAKKVVEVKAEENEVRDIKPSSSLLSKRRTMRSGALSGALRGGAQRVSNGIMDKTVDEDDDEEEENVEPIADIGYLLNWNPTGPSTAAAKRAVMEERASTKRPSLEENAPIGLRPPATRFRSAPAMGMIEENTKENLSSNGSIHSNRSNSSSHSGSLHSHRSNTGTSAKRDDTSETAKTENQSNNGSVHSNITSSSNRTNDSQSNRSQSSNRSSVVAVKKDDSIETAKSKESPVADTSVLIQEQPSPPSSVHPDFQKIVSHQNIINVNNVPYVKLGVIGKGGSCKVYRTLSKDRNIVAIKKVKIAGMARKSIEGYANEIALLRRLRGNPAIIQLFDSEVDFKRKAIFLVMEPGEVDLNHVVSLSVLFWIYIYIYLIYAIHAK